MAVADLGDANLMLLPVGKLNQNGIETIQTICH